MNLDKSGIRALATRALRADISEPPCTGCRHHQLCKTRELACADFMLYCGSPVMKIVKDANGKPRTRVNNNGKTVPIQRIIKGRSPESKYYKSLFPGCGDRLSRA